MPDPEIERVLQKYLRERDIVAQEAVRKHPLSLESVLAELRPEVDGHTLLRSIGPGSFSEVWLAQTIAGFRAIKFVYRRTFDTDSSFHRRFNEILSYLPVSCSHPGLVAILYAGRNDSAGYFYYVMEAADDVERGQDIEPRTYRPKTLTEHLRGRGLLPLHESSQLAMSLTDGLAHLHARGVVHRDIEPSKIVFVNGMAKYADVGLVTDAADAEEAAYVGGPGYFPPEGPGSPRADIYSLGMVLYEIIMGEPHAMFPKMPIEIGSTSDTHALLRLNEIILKACETNAQDRFRSALELRGALLEAINASGCT